MKKIAYIVLILLIPALLSAQSMRIGKFYHTHKLKKNSFHMAIPGFLIRLGAAIGQKRAENEQGKMAFRMLKRVKWAKVLMIEDNPNVNTKKVNRMITQLAEKNAFENLVVVRDGKTRVNLMIREKNDRIKNLFLVFHDDEDFTMIYLKTKLSMDKLSKFLKGFDSVKGMEKMLGK